MPFLEGGLAKFACFLFGDCIVSGVCVVSRHFLFAWMFEGVDVVGNDWVGGHCAVFGEGRIR